MGLRMDNEEEAQSQVILVVLFFAYFFVSDGSFVLCSFLSLFLFGIFSRLFSWLSLSYHLSNLPFTTLTSSPPTFCFCLLIRRLHLIYLHRHVFNS